MCEALTFLLDNIYIRFSTELFRQNVGIPIGTHCAPLVADLFCYKRDFMIPLSEEKISEVIEAFSSTSRYLDDLLNIDNKYFDGLIKQMYPSELQSSKANSSETKTPFLDWNLSILGDLFLVKFMINAMILILRLLIFLIWMGMFLIEHPTVFISCNQFGLSECLAMLLTSTLEINYILLKF